MSGLLGKKLGMTTYFSAEEGKAVACTLVEAGPCVVTQVRTTAKDGYDAYQLAYGDKKEKNTTSSLIGHFKKAGTTPKKHLVEFDLGEATFSLGQTISLDGTFVEGDFLDVTGTSKGKGFQGVVKRHGFGGVGGQTHGQHNRARHPGSIGACSFPSRVFKGMRMGGRMGTDTVKVQNLKVLKIIADKNLLVISGPVPGAKNSLLILEK